jgi:hypothetical protein
VVIVAIGCKLFKTSAERQNCCGLLQTVAISCKTKKNENLMSRCASAIPLQLEGQNAGNVDGHDFTPDPKKIKI